MADYKSHQEELESMLEGHVFFPNMLEFYDNVTYNIRFYLLSSQAQDKLAYERNFNSNIDYDIDPKDKIIIAETGVSTRYSIDSLKINAVHSSLGTFKPTGYTMDMVIKESDGCSLSNKISVISKILGYKSYIHQPYHIDIWFSGYRNDNGKPIKMIGNKYLTYEVIINQVKTNVELSGATYNFSLNCNPMSIMNKEISTMFDIGLINIPNTPTLRNFTDEIERLINDKYCVSHPEWKHLYQDEPLVKIRNLINGDYTYTDLSDEEKIDMINKASNSDNSSKSMLSLTDAIISKVSENKKPSNQTLINNETKTVTKTMTRLDDWTSISIHKEHLDDVVIDKFMPPQITELESGAYITSNSVTSIDVFFQDICAQSSFLQNRVAKIDYSLENISNYGGKEHYRVYADITFTSVPIFDYYIEHSKERDKNNNNVLSDDTLKDLRFKTQKKEIETILKQGTLNKLYEWQWNGTNTSIIEVNAKLDYLWYANIGMINAENIINATIDNPRQTKINDEMIHEKERIDKIKQSNLQDVIEKYNAPFATIRKLASDGRLYIDDMYNVISDETKAELLSNRNVLEQNTTLTETNGESASQIKDLDVVSAKVGYNNVFTAGALSEINLTILGDPYWLGLLDDKLLYNGVDSSQYVKLQKFGFTMRTTLPQKNNGDGGYDLSDCVDFSNIFELVDSTHLFENGRFTQQLHGQIDTSLIHLARLRFKNPKR